MRVFPGLPLARQFRQWETILSLVAALELAKRRDVLMTMLLTALSGK
jgi:hypothetical protein